MNSESIAKTRFKIEGVDVQTGLINVQYIYEYEPGKEDTIDTTLGIPMDSAGRFMEPDKVVKYVEKYYPYGEFQRRRVIEKNKTVHTEELEKLNSKEFDVSVDKDPLSEEINKVEDEPKGDISIYGDLREVTKIRHIVLDTLESLGLIK